MGLLLGRSGLIRLTCWKKSAAGPPMRQNRVAYNLVDRPSRICYFRRVARSRNHRLLPAAQGLPSGTYHGMNRITIISSLFHTENIKRTNYLITTFAEVARAPLPRVNRELLGRWWMIHSSSWMIHSSRRYSPITSQSGFK